ncbi:hypothetical protein [Nesterenkonia alba]|uniref:hypothetical protein n=1 Tax=Nesterenkonia alba TaxID=515814 RepID=UPI0012EC4D2A|nr:hypothetical protein [Nesterenkonia alba]
MRAGKLLRLKPGIFVDTRQWESARLSQRHRAYAAAIGLWRPGLVFCRQTALSLYGTPLLTWPRTVHHRTPHRGHVGVTSTQYFPVQAIRCLRGGNESTQTPTVQVPVPDVVLEGGTPVRVIVEALPYVLIDTLPHLPRQNAIVVLDAVLAGRYGFGVTVTEQGLDTAEQALDPGPGWAVLRQFADPRSESVGESRARVLFDELGFEPPKLQQELYLPGIGTVRPDFMWEDVICEFDGKVKYTRALAGKDPEETVYREKLREDALRAQGFTVVRLTWEDLEHPQQLGRKLLRTGVPHRALRGFGTAA